MLAALLVLLGVMLPGAASAQCSGAIIVASGGTFLNSDVQAVCGFSGGVTQVVTGGAQPNPSGSISNGWIFDYSTGQTVGRPSTGVFTVTGTPGQFALNASGSVVSRGTTGNAVVGAGTMVFRNGITAVTGLVARLLGVTSNPSSVAAGATVTINGSFVSGNTYSVQFGSASPVTTTAASSSQLSVTAPAGSGTVTFTVTDTTLSKSAGTGSFAYAAAASPPTISTVSPAYGVAGATPAAVTITGTNFSATNSSVTFGGTAGSVTANSATSITVTPPNKSAGAVNVVVTNNTSSQSVTQTNGYTYISAPTIAAAFSPTGIASGGSSTLTLTLANPNSGTALSGVGVASAAFPSGLTGSSPGTTCSGGTATLSAGTISLSGASLAAATSCTVTVLVTSSAANTYNYTTGTVSASGPVALTGATATTATGLTVSAAAPTVTALAPASGPTAGTNSVVITGTNFTGATAANFGATPATGFIVDSATQITATAPSGSAGVVNVTVTTAGGTSATSAANQYSYVAAPTAPTVTTPANGATTNANRPTYSGIAVAGATVTVSVDGSSIGTTTAGGGTWSLAQPTDLGDSTHTVAATAANAGGTSPSSSTTSFTVDTTAPAAPVVTTPANGSSTSNTTPSIGGTAEAGSTVTIVIDGTSAGTAPATGGNWSFTPGSALSQASHTVRATATDGAGNASTNSNTNSFTVIAALATTQASASVSGAVGTALTPVAPVTANGGTGTLSYALSGGTLPSGLSFSSTNGQLSGTPAAVLTATTFTVTVTDQATPTAQTSSKTFQLSVARGSQTITFGALLNASLSASPLALSATSDSTLAVTFASATTGVCTVSGTTLTLLSTGTCTIDADQAGNANYSAATQVQRSFTVTPATLSVTPGAASGTAVGSSFSQANPATGGTAPYHYALASGTLPAGTTLNASTGAVGGTPTNAGAFGYAISATDGQGTPVTTTGTTVSGTIAKGAQSLTFTSTAPGGAQAGGASYTPTATATSGLTVALTLDGASTGCTLASGVVSFTNAGTCVIDATQAGDANWTAATQIQQSFAVSHPPAPTAANKPSVTIPYNSGGTAIDLAASISGAHTSIAVATAAAHGTTGVADDVITYTPATGYFGADSFTYTATGPGGTSAPATVTLTVATPGAPTVAAASASVAYNTAKAIDLAASITGAHASVAVAGPPAHGTTSVTGDVITYTPASGYFGADSFTFSATGPGGTSAAATVTLTVATPGAPIVAAASASVGYNTSKAIDLSASVTGVHASIAIVTAAGHGTASVAGDVITYTPASGYFGADSFTYTATGPGGMSSAATVSLTVATPGAPAAAAVSASTGYDSAKAIDLAGSISGVHTGIAVATAPAHGTASVAGNIVTYTPTGGFYGADNFTYTATGPGGISAAATISVTVGTPAAPTAADKSGVAVAYNSSVAIDLSGSAAGVHGSITVVSAPTHGTTAVAGDIVTYTPTSGYHGADSFTYTVTGPGGISAAATVGLTVATPAAPTAADKSGVAVAYNGSAAIDLSGTTTGVRGSIVVASAPAHGTASVAGDIVTYTPTTGYYGADSFTYTATGPGGTSAAATVAVTVGAPPAPVAANVSVDVAYDTAKAIDLAGSVSGVHTGIAVATAPAKGTASVAGDTLTYTPNADATGSDSFTYAATGPGGTSAAATVTIAIATPPPPAASGVSTTVQSSEVKGGGDVDIDLSSLVAGAFTSIRVSVQPQHGTVLLTGGGLKTSAAPTPGKIRALAADQAIIAVYTPTAGYYGPDSFQFEAVGPGGVSSSAVVAITVVGDPPVAQAKTANATDGQMVSVDLTAGATNGPFTAATILSITPQDSATTAIVQGGTAAAPTFRLDVTPTARFGGQIVIGYQLRNQFGPSATATVTVTVKARPDPSLDPTVRAVSDAQAEAARLFSRTQVDNFMRRTEQLHGHGANRSQMGARLGFDALMTGRVDPRSLNRNGDLDMLRDERVAQTTDARNAADQATAAQAARQKAANTGTTDDAAPSKIAFWTGGAIQIGRRDATTNRARMSVTTAGLSGGADLRVSERLTIGIGGGYGNDVTRIGHGDGRVSSHDAVGAGYFSAVPVDGAFIDGVAGYGALHFRTRRLAPGNGATALGDRDGQLGFASFSTGIDRSDDALRWSLYGRGDYQRAVLEAYAESGADMFNLRFGRRVVESLTSVLGGRVALSRPVSFGAITPWLRAEWSHEFQGSGRQSVDYADIAGPALYGIDTQGWGGEQFSLSFGNQLDVNGWSLGLEVGLRAANKERAGTAKVGASTKF